MEGVLLSGGWLWGLSRVRGRGQDSFWRSLGDGTRPCCSSFTVNVSEFQEEQGPEKEVCLRKEDFGKLEWGYLQRAN